MFRIAIKDLKLFAADKRAMLLTFLLPIALISLFAMAFGGSGKRESRPMELVVADEDKTEHSRNMISRIDSLKEFEVVLTALDTAERLIKKGDANAALVLHRGFGDSITKDALLPVELKYDAAREMETGILQGALAGAFMRITGNKSMIAQAIRNFDAQNPGMDSAVRGMIHQQIAGNFQGPSSQPVITATPLVAEKENSPGLVQAVAGTAIMMLLFSVAGMGASLLDEKQEGTLKKLLYSPMHPNNILYGKMLSVNILSIIQLIVLFLFAWLVFGLNIFQNIPSLALMILATAFACSSFGVFLASFAKSRSQVQGVSTLIILTMSAVGGSMIPLFVMPIWMQKMAVISVNYWGIQGFYDIFWRMLPVTDPVFLTRIAVLIAIGIVLNLISVVLYKKNVLQIA